MSTYENRIAALEQKIADIELERLYEKRKTPTLSSEQLYDAQQLNHRLTMLLGILSGQEKAIHSLDNNVAVIKEQVDDLKQDNAQFYSRFDRLDTKLTTIDQRLTGLEQRFTSLEGRFETFEQNVSSRFEAQDRRFETLERNMNGRFETQDKKLDQVLQLLATMTNKADN